jgi:hypothetical protein
MSFLVIDIFRQKIESICEFASNELDQFSTLCNTLGAALPNCTSPFMNCQQKFAERIRRMVSDSKIEAPQTKADFDVDSVKLKIQSIYHAAEQNTSDQLKPMERLRQTLTSIKMSTLFEVKLAVVRSCSKIPIIFRLSNNSELIYLNWAHPKPMSSNSCKLWPRLLMFSTSLHKV